MLHGAGMLPRLAQAADRPWADQPRAGRPIKGDGRAAASGREMGYRRVGPDINGSAPEKGRQAGPIEAPALANDRRVGGGPKPVDIISLGRVPPFGGDNRGPALGQAPSEVAPARVRPTLVTVERVDMQHGVGPRRRKLVDSRPLRANDVGRVLEAERGCEREQLGDPVTAGLGGDGNMISMALPPCSRLARRRHEPDPSSPRYHGEDGRPGAGLGRHHEIVAAPESADQSERLSHRRALRHGHHVVDVRIAPEDALAAAEYENVEPRPWKTSPHGSDERGGEQNVAEAP